MECSVEATVVRQRIFQHFAFISIQKNFFLCVTKNLSAHPGLHAAQWWRRLYWIPFLATFYGILIYNLQVSISAFFVYPVKTTISILDADVQFP